MLRLPTGPSFPQHNLSRAAVPLCLHWFWIFADMVSLLFSWPHLQFVIRQTPGIPSKTTPHQKKLRMVRRGQTYRACFSKGGLLKPELRQPFGVLLAASTTTSMLGPRSQRTTFTLEALH